VESWCSQYQTLCLVPTNWDETTVAGELASPIILHLHGSFSVVATSVIHK